MKPILALIFVLIMVVLAIGLVQAHGTNTNPDDQLENLDEKNNQNYWYKWNHDLMHYSMNTFFPLASFIGTTNKVTGMHGC